MGLYRFILYGTGYIFFFWIKTTEIYSLTVLELEVQNQDIGKDVLPLKA